MHYLADRIRSGFFGSYTCPAWWPTRVRLPRLLNLTTSRCHRKVRDRIGYFERSF